MTLDKTDGRKQGCRNSGSLTANVIIHLFRARDSVTVSPTCDGCETGEGVLGIDVNVIFSVQSQTKLETFVAYNKNDQS